jgi:cell division protein FtsB
VYRQKRAAIKDLQQQVDALQKENGRYADQIKALKSDPEAIEKEAREQLHYARPGEVVYVPPSMAVPAKPDAKAAKK